MRTLRDNDVVKDTEILDDVTIDGRDIVLSGCIIHGRVNITGYSSRASVLYNRIQGGINLDVDAVECIITGNACGETIAMIEPKGKQEKKVQVKLPEYQSRFNTLIEDD